MGAAEDAVRKQQSARHMEQMSALERENEEKARLIEEIRAEAQAAISRLESKGFPGGRIGQRLEKRPGLFRSRDTWIELACWSVVYDYWYDDFLKKDVSTTLWSDGMIQIPGGLYVDKLKSLLGALRGLGA